MPRYRVREGSVLPHGGKVLEGGAVLELPRHIGQDNASIASYVDEIDEDGHIVAPTPHDDLERFRSHERVGMLRDRLVAAQAVVKGLKARLEEEEERLAAEVHANEAKHPPKDTAKPHSTAAKVKE